MQQSDIIPPFHKEGLFHPVRKWRTDYSWVYPEYRLAVEIEGGAFIEHRTKDGKSGGHTRGSGFMKDIEKYNALALEGFFLLRFTPRQVEKGEALQMIEKWFTKRASILVKHFQNEKSDFIPLN